MLNPNYPVNIIGDQWNLIATGVTSGLVRKKSGGGFLQTYRLSGRTAPTDVSEGVDIFLGTDVEPIVSEYPIDVYIWGHKPGVLRLDL